MKKILTAAAIFITLSVSAQGLLPLPTWPITIDSSNSTLYRERKYYLDTVPVLFLLCDTAYTKLVYYEKGYEVLRMIWTNYGLVNNGDGNWYVSTSEYEPKHENFLNAKCKPFDKSIIIWGTKRIKP